MERITREKMAAKLGAFLSSEIMPKMRDPANIGMLAVANTALGRRAIENKIGRAFDAVADNDGTVDIHEMREAVVAYAKAAGGIPILFDRVTLKVDDIDAFFASL